MSLFSFVSTYDEAWKAVILPGRQEYSMFDLGPSDFVVKGKRVQRTDFRLLNKRGHIIECSFYQHVENEDPIPCVVYLHANGCCRLEAVQYADLVLSINMSLFCFDFSGCGKSDGLYSSVGWFEQEDLECIIQYLYQTGRVSKVAVWGRSMGAITTILYAEKDPRIHCLILDSPFTSFKQLVKEIAKTKASIPGFLSTGAFSMIRKTIMKKANFDIDNLRPIKYVDKIKIPALFGAAKDDNFVSPQHTKDLYNAYGGPKQMVIFDGDHNSERPFNWLIQVKEFLQVYLLSDNNDSKSIKSFKTYFGPTEKAIRTGKNQEAQEVPKEKTNPNSLKKLPLSPPGQLQKPMAFTWLEHSASTPNLLTAAEIFKEEKSNNQMLKDVLKGGNQTTKASNSKPKPNTSGFGDFYLLGKLNNSSSQAHLTVQKTYTIEPLHKNDKFVKTKDVSKYPITHIPIQYPKTSRPPLKEFSDHNNTHSFSHISEVHSNKSTQSTQNHVGSNTSLDTDISETKHGQTGVKHHNVPHYTSYHIDTKRLHAPSKERTNNNSSHNLNYGITNSKQSVNSIDDTQVKLPNVSLNIHHSSSTPASNNVIPDSYIPHLMNTKSLNMATYPSNETDRLHGMITTRNDINNSTSIGQSLTNTINDNGKPPSKENMSPRLQKRKPVTFQISLNSNIPIINPNQTGPSFDINFLESKTYVQNENRRASDNVSSLLRKIVAPGPQIVGTDGKGIYYYNSGESLKK